MRTTFLAPCVPHLLCALAMAAGLAPTAQAADDPASPTLVEASGTGTKGAYIGLGLGMSKLGPRNDGHDDAHGDRPVAAKFHGGYRFTDTWGVEAGWVQLGRVNDETTAGGGSTAHHNGDARSLYFAGTGRVALGSNFSLIGKAGVSFGRVSAKDSGDAQFTLGGSKTSPMFGIGAEYQASRNIALTFDLDGYGKVSDKVKAATATLGVRYSF